MNILCLCPTYGRPRHLLENTLACFENQDHPQEQRRLMLLDDGGNVEPQEGNGWWLFSSATRYDSLPEKYNAMITMAYDWWPEWDAVCVWDDDDIYLSHHISASAKAMEPRAWSHPRQVFSTYGVQPGEPLRTEAASGRFHGSLAIRRDLLDKIGGWVQTKRADFDQQQIATCHSLASEPGRPDDDGPSYVFRWGDTGAGHCQGLMSSAGNEDWYERNKKDSLSGISDLSPVFDAAAKVTLRGLACRLQPSQHAFRRSI